MIRVTLNHAFVGALEVQLNMTTLDLYLDIHRQARFPF